MGSLVAFRWETDPTPSAATSDPGDAAFAENEAALAGDVPGRKAAVSTPPRDFKHLGSSGFSRETTETGPPVDLDGYLLVLLADQELSCGRDVQAQALVDAAYAAFDRRA